MAPKSVLSIIKSESKFFFILKKEKFRQNEIFLNEYKPLCKNTIWPSKIYGIQVNASTTLFQINHAGLVNGKTVFSVATNNIKTNFDNLFQIILIAKSFNFKE